MKKLGLSEAEITKYEGLKSHNNHFLFFIKKNSSLIL